MKKLYFILLAASFVVFQSANAQFVYQESFTNQTNFGNPTGWDPIDGLTVWNVYETHGNPSFGLIRSFTTGQSDSIGTSASTLINVPLNAELQVDARVMAFALYPSSIVTLPAGASLAVKATDGLVTATILSMTSVNQNTDANWVTLTGSLIQFAGSQIQLIVVGKNGPNAPSESYFIDLDNFRVTDGTVGVKENISNKISVFPNPTAEQFVISGVEGNVIVSVSDVLGNVVKTLNTTAHSSLSYDLKGLINGIYLIKVENETRSFIQRIVKN